MRTFVKSCIRLHPLQIRVKHSKQQVASCIRRIFIEALNNVLELYDLLYPYKCFRTL
jgi:hypothetical protein